MEIEEAFTAYLKAHPGLTALISNRFFSDDIPQHISISDGPVVTYIKISDVKIQMLSGQSKVESPNFQFTVHSTTKPVARAVANQIKAALCNYCGFMGAIKIQKIELQNELPNKETSPDGSVQVYTEDLEFQIFFEKE